ncbi:MAG: hypothetical protein RI580_07305 [Halothece sp. Uz-M2-17]|nr:hypothetical protein [Halothece sp. Uz-M2-17]
MRKTLIAAIAPLIILGVPLSLQAQTESEERSTLEIEYRKLVQLNRAKNLARQAAEQANGGLTEYRAEPAMHGPPETTNHEQLAEGVWQFTFQGRRPTAEEYTLESVVVVNINTGETTVEYNGPIRE